MIDQLITALSKEVEMSAAEIADTIWLALQMQEFPSESVFSSFPVKTEDEKEIKKPENQLDQQTLPKTSDLEETSNQSPEEPKAGIYPRNEQQTSKSSNLSFKVPDAPSLREPLTLARALKPLMRRVPSGRELVLDEAATIQRIADEGLWIPVLKSAVEPWLDLELVVDESISMQIWRHTIREWERLLKNYGIFRDVRVWGLITDEKEQVQIRRGIGATAKNQTPRSPKELIDPTGRRLVLVVSDCVSFLWRNGELTPVLELWAKQGSMAIVQMLPKWLWKRTALGRASEVRLRGLTPGVFNQNLIAKEVSLWDELEEETGVKVPVFTLEPDKVTTWAQMLSGKGSIWTLGYVFKLDAPVKKERELFNLNHSELNAEQRVQAFRVTASPMARKLAGLLASAPVISLPIVRLIRESLLKDAQQVHVAEVFLGGLLKPLSEINADTNPDYVQYDFMDGVQELLVDSVPSEYVLNVVDEVSKYVAKKVGLSLEDFAAVLKNPQEVRDSGIVEEVGYFATVTAQVLRRLGGEYVTIADSIETNTSIGNVKKQAKNNGDFLWQQGNTKIYSFCTNEPWNLPFDVFVIPVGRGVGFGLLAQSFKEFLGQNSIFLHESINDAKKKINKSIISPSKPLIFTLPPEINDQLPFGKNNHERFIICATVESPEITVVNAGKSVESIINLAVDRNLKCVVIPLLGTGINKLSVDEVVPTMLSAISKTLKNLSFNPIKEIFIVEQEKSKIKTINQIAHRLFIQQDIDKFEALSETGIDYTQLRDLLAEGKWREADQETARVMLQASGQEERGWLDEEDMQRFPATDLQTIDQLWLEYSNGKFGFSVQKQIWLSVGGQPGDYDNEIYQKFGEYVGWYIKDKDDWLNWSAHTFSLDAPQGHLPRYLPSQQRRIRPYLLSRSDLKVQLENFVPQAGEISKSDKDNESLENTLLVTDNQQLVEQINNQRDIIKNRYTHNGIRIIGDRGAGKTTFMTALSSLSQKNNEIPFEVLPQNQESQELLYDMKNILMQGLSLEPTNPAKLEEIPFYSFRISLQPSLFIQPLAAIRGKTIEMDISFKEYPGELFNDLRHNRQNRKLYGDYLDDCATVSKLLLLIDGTNRDDKGYKEIFINLSEEIANRLENKKEILNKYRIAVVISKCEEPLLWTHRHKAQELMSLKFWETQKAFQRWSQSWGCKMAYFTCSSFGVMGEPPRANFKFIYTNDRGSIGVINNPQRWKPFGLLAPIYWLHTGKRDSRLQK